MDDRAECTHCRVLMTTWAAPGSPVRYWRCPMCGHAHSSLYGEAFRSGAGARAPCRPAAPEQPGHALPQATAEEIRWASLKARAARWFARLEREGKVAARPSPQVRCEPALAPAAPRRRPRTG